MKKTNILVAIIIAILFCSACHEWDPVLTFDYKDIKIEKPKKLHANKTIAELKSMYKSGESLNISQDIVIAGQVTTDDRSGNFYRSLYIQDETGGIEVKIGHTGLYNDYKLGQWIYVNCNGLTLGAYNGMIQLGFSDPSGEYETSYIDVQYIIDTHIFKGKLGSPVEPKVLSVNDLNDNSNYGRYVTLEGVRYGSNPNNLDVKEIFALIYVNQNGNKKSNSNRIFLSDKSYGVTTWAMSKDGFLKYLNAGNFDKATLADRTTNVGSIKSELVKNASAVTVSQYFVMQNKQIQVRTSGYSRFADTQIDEQILSGTEISLTGILSKYRDDIQFTLIDLNGVKIEK